MSSSPRNLKADGTWTALTIDTTFLISHRLPLEDTPRGYANCKTKQNEWTKVVLMPHGGASGSA